MAQSNPLTCPSCTRELSQATVELVTVDLCKSGCGGIWFDKKELERFDDPAVFLPPELFRVIPNSLVAIDRNKARLCPRCSNQVLQQQIENKSLGIEVDSCVSCKGVWLDLGELNSIREDKKKIAEMEFEINRLQLLAAQLKNMPKGLLAVLKLIFS